MIKMTENDFRKSDPQHMYNLVAGFPKQWLDAVSLTENLQLSVDPSDVRNILIIGMGGSAIGGDLIKAYSANSCPVPVEVNRHYSVPGWVDKHTLVITSSYSGNTEETLTATAAALDRNAKVICVTSGGKLKDIAEHRKLDHIIIPSGMQPRAALAVSFIPQYRIFELLGYTGEGDDTLVEAGRFLQKKAEQLSNPASSSALELADKIKDTLPIIYSDATLMAPVNLRWRGQFEENAKTLAYGNLFPEMNHNEIVGWENIKHLNNKISVILLQDRDDNPRIKLRMKIIGELIGDSLAGYHILESDGPNRLARMFSLVHLADWTSFYLSILYGSDPTPVEKIDLLKQRLA